MKRKSFLAIMVLMLAIVLLTACNKDGKHNFAEEWSNNETHHWHACTDKGCKETKDKAEHTWDGGNVTVEPTTEQKGTMVYTCTVCRREKTESIDELVVGTEYTITFDSKGGSAVQPIKASAGAAITAPTDPTKDGFVFAGWYESTDGGTTLSDTAFSFSYMPARVFTLYAKWATADIKGKTFKKVDAIVEWESEAVKQALLAEMEMTEDEYVQFVASSKVTVEFAADKNTATVTYDQGPGEVGGQGSFGVLYKIKGTAIVFYDSQEDMEKEIPAHKYGLIAGSTFELKMLAMNEIELGDDFAALNNLETFMAYSCMTSASEFLSVSFYSSDITGTTYQPSEIALQCKKVFKNIIAYDKFDFDGKKESMYALRPAFDTVADMIGKGKKVPESLLEIFAQNPEYSAKLDSLINAKDKVPFKIFDKKNAEKLFGKNLNISASQLEKFNLCRFSYFCNYGLNVRERQRAEINPMQYGTIVHYILERFFGEYTKEEYLSLEEDKFQKIVCAYLAEYAVKYFGEEQLESNSFTYRLKTILDNVMYLMKHIMEELSQSEFFVADCELKIGEDIPSYTIVLPDGHKIAVCGSVDRVDIMQRADITYLRIIDYKTGTKQFKLSDILYGINLQMLLYLHSIEASGGDKYGEIVPAGILYMPATVPYISSDSLKSIDKLPDELNKKLKMNGLLLKDTEIIHGMDKTDAATYIPVKIKAGEPVSSTSLATLAEFGKIFKKVDMLIAEMGKNIYNGNIEAKPLKGGHDSCEYCPYDSVCAYRQSNPITCFSVDNKTVIEEITNEINGKEEE